MFARFLITTFLLLFCQNILAEWQIASTRSLGTALLQKEINAIKGDALVAVICVPEPTLIVQWVGDLSDITLSIDTVKLDVPKQVSIRSGMQALTLKSEHFQGLINGLDLQLEATLASGEIITAETSLLGFSNEFRDADMDCSI